ncbi:PAX-interacting protein 1-like [Physella acuta]|uniref:PAX-interacting protein 1-like n=1 Tax=Physella acuta TaxID=109671 RepID=UPI0027DE361F|nr:PAX-interacting protein 1-like [Physella acuta]
MLSKVQVESHCTCYTVISLRFFIQVDRLTDSLGKRNVLDNAYFEVDEIRRQYLADEAKRQEEEEEQLKHKTWNQNRGTHVVSSQLRHQQPFLQQRSRPFTWDLINNQSMTLSSSSPFQQQLSIQQPSLQQHSLQQPCLQQQLGLQQHSLQQQLSLQQPNLQQPNLQQPGLQQPGLQQPGLQQPGLQQPNLQQPGLQQPGLQQPILQQPGLQQPGLQQPQRPTQYPNQLQQQAHPPPQSAHPPQQTVHPPQQTVHSLPPPPTSQNQQAVQPNACRLSQQQQVPPNLCRISKMATVLPLQRCPDVGHGSGQQMEAHSRLDNDPAIMSYSYKAAAAAAGNK